MTVALRLSGLEAGYGAHPVLHQIDLEVREAEVCAVLGPNGAGKSTLLRSVMNMVPEVRGRIELGGTDVVGEATHRIARRGVGYVLEGRGILNSLTVRENLLLAGRRKGGSSAEARRALVAAAEERFPVLGEYLDHPAGQLSGGQQQMLAIARAVADRPRLLLVDEPSLGLAPIIRKQLVQTFTDIAHRDGIAVLLAEQDMNLAVACASRCYVLRLGSVVDQLTGEELGDAERLRRAYLGRRDAAPALKET